MELKLEIPEQEYTASMKDLLESVGKLAGRITELGSYGKLQSTAAAVKRSVMTFDKLNRLTASSSKGSGKSNLERFIGAIREMETQRILSGPLNMAKKLLAGLGAEIKTVDDHLEELQVQLTQTPLSFQQVLNITGAFCSQLNQLPAAAEQAQGAMSRVDKSVLFTAGLMEVLPLSATEAAKGLISSFTGTASYFQHSVSTPLKNQFSQLFSDLLPNAKAALAGTKQVVSEGTDSITETVKSTWEKVLGLFNQTDDTTNGVVTGVVSTMKSVINRLIGGINTAIVEPFSGINEAFSKLKSFTVNGVKPFKQLSFNVSMPSIPLLATGAVLPANKPFLAMVGDQKHGTNVEAPLATIQEAVANVMREVVEAQAAGNNATVQLLRQILEAVLGIRLDEDTLGRAALSYSARQTVMTGGF